MNRRQYSPLTADQWELDLHQHWDPACLDPELPPVMLVPGYGMNAFVLGFHPSDVSMIQYFVSQGFEVWTTNLRGQGRSRPVRRRSGRKGLGELALEDIPASLEAIVNCTRTRRETVHGIGCSLGASILFGYLAHTPAHALESMISLGGPLRWDEVHPLVRVAFASPRLVGALPIRGARLGARLAVPAIRRLPSLGAIYLNASQIDLDAAGELVRTVENPSRRLNREIAAWVGAGDLHLRGRNVTEALRERELPVLCVVANADGIVPPGSVLSATDPFPDAEVLHVGDEEVWFAHADLFVGRTARERVFAPLAEWMRK